MPRPDRAVQHRPRFGKMDLGAVLFALLGAPCAAAALIGPLAVGFGLSSLAGALGALGFRDQAAIRLPLLALAALATPRSR